MFPPTGVLAGRLPNRIKARTEELPELSEQLDKGPLGPSVDPCLRSEGESLVAHRLPRLYLREPLVPQPVEAPELAQWVVLPVLAH